MMMMIMCSSVLARLECARNLAASLVHQGNLCEKTSAFIMCAYVIPYNVCANRWLSQIASHWLFRSVSHSDSLKVTLIVWGGGGGGVSL